MNFKYLIGILLAAHTAASYAQVDPGVLGYNDRETILSGEIVARERLIHEDSLGSSAWLVTYKSGRRAIVKSMSDGARKEVAASIVSELFRLNIVPLTELLEHRGRLASFQLWIEGVENASSRTSLRYTPEAAFFDFVIGYRDGVYGRPKKNILEYGSEGLILIDNAESFAAFDSWQREHIDEAWSNFVKFDLKRAFGVNIKDLSFSHEQFERIESMPEDEIREALKDLLTKREIDGVIARKNKYIKMMKRYQSQPRRCSMVVARLR